ncbi:MAG: hypothetical protein AABY06_03000 [Nanoarchaeota archaeon]
MENKKNPLRGQERRVISTKLYRLEFVNFVKLCQTEKKSVHAKLREMIREEIKKKFGEILGGEKETLWENKTKVNGVWVDDKDLKGEGG